MLPEHRLIVLLDVSEFFIFFCSRRRKGESEAPGRGGLIFSEIPRRGGGSSGGGRAEGPGRCHENQERKNHISIKKRTEHPPFQTPPQNSLCGGPFSWKIKEKGPPT